MGLLGRAGTPEPILRRMHAALAQVPGQPEIRSRRSRSRARTWRPAGRSDCRRFLAAEVEKWGQVIRDNNITLES